MSHFLSKLLLQTQPQMLQRVSIISLLHFACQQWESHKNAGFLLKSKRNIRKLTIQLLHQTVIIFVKSVKLSQAIRKFNKIYFKKYKTCQLHQQAGQYCTYNFKLLTFRTRKVNLCNQKPPMNNKISMNCNDSANNQLPY